MDVVRTTIFTVVTQKFQKISKFIVFRFLKNHEISVLGTKIIPTTFELNLTGSLYYGSAVSNLALFSVSKNIDISKIATCGGIKISLLGP